MAKKKPVPLPPVLEIRDESLSVIRKAVEPVTAKRVAGLLSMGCKVPETVVLPILEQCVATGLLHSFPGATAKGKSRFWDRDRVEWGRFQIEKSIRNKGPLTTAKLKTAAKGLSDSQFKQAFQSLIDAGRVREHPPVGRSRTSKYGTEPPECEPYLKDVGETLTKIVRQLIEAGVDRNSLARTIWVRLDEMGLPLPATRSASNAAEPGEKDGLDLLMLMRLIEPGAERGALVSSRELRRAANLDKRQFDQMVLELARIGRLMLHRHDHASGLSDSARDELVTDGAGTYYVGMALRRTEG